MSESLSLPGILDDVRRFLGGLKEELPELFKPAPAPRVAPPASAPAAPVEPLVLEASREYYIEQAATVFRERTRFWAVRMGLVDRVKRVTIKDQRTLWGSCTEAGSLNFNWRVVLAPPEVLDYLVIHELAHLREMNHSPRFWAHVSEHCADYKARRKWLRVNAQRLKSA